MLIQRIFFLLAMGYFPKELNTLEPQTLKPDGVL